MIASILYADGGWISVPWLGLVLHPPRSFLRWETERNRRGRLLKNNADHSEEEKSRLFILFQLPLYEHHYPDDLTGLLFRADYRIILWVGRLEYDLVVKFEEPLDGNLAVNSSNDDIPVGWLLVTTA